MVRVDIWWWYELTSLRGTSWYGYELTWVRVDIYCVVITSDVNSYHHFILALLGTSWHHLWYELTSLVVRVDFCWWYELTWVRVDIGRVDMSKSWLSHIYIHVCINVGPDRQYPANTRRWPNVGLMLGQHLNDGQCQPNIGPMLYVFWVCSSQLNT